MVPQVSLQLGASTYSTNASPLFVERCEKKREMSHNLERSPPSGLAGPDVKTVRSTLRIRLIDQMIGNLFLAQAYESPSPQYRDTGSWVDSVMGRRSTAILASTSAYVTCAALLGVLPNRPFM